MIAVISGINLGKSCNTPYEKFLYDLILNDNKQPQRLWSWSQSLVLKYLLGASYHCLVFKGKQNVIFQFIIYF